MPIGKNVQNTISNMKSGIEIALKDLHAQEKTFYLQNKKNMPTQEREFINIKRQQLIKEELYLFLFTEERRKRNYFSRSNP